MRCLVTGGAGFIGTALTNRLAAAGHQVRVLDDLSAGDTSRLHPEALFDRGDVRDRPKLWTLLQQVDCVFHLAARVSVQESVLYPREYNDVNVGGTVSLAEAIRDAGVGRVVLASSATVYGPQATQPVKETSWPHPQAPYAVSKLAAEYYTFALGQLNGIETVALRIFNAYGPNQRIPPAHAPVVPLFAKNLLSGASIVIHGDGSQTRDFVYIDDVVDALIGAATAPDVDQQVINVGSGQETSINALIASLGQVTGRRPDVIYNRQQYGGILRLVADLDQAHKLLGYRPRVSLHEGLERLLAEDPRFNRPTTGSRGRDDRRLNPGWQR
ncbi:MAG: epimerase [Chloroflexi bacterium HGW-Chloroflexi-1]|nr:MAG: epimerase [Chloroflexi bacterium HGW-Chloroflexi-1]